MQDIVERAKRTAAAAAERASWEANRLRRVNARQHELELAQRERGALLEQIGGVVLDLEHRGQLTHQPLVALAKRLRALNQDIASGSADIQSIRNENFKPGTSPQPTPQMTRVTPIEATAREHPCPTCGQPVRDTAAYCSACGTRLR